MTWTCDLGYLDIAYNLQTILEMMNLAQLKPLRLLGLAQDIQLVSTTLLSSKAIAVESVTLYLLKRTTSYCVIEAALTMLGGISYYAGRRHFVLC